MSSTYYVLDALLLLKGQQYCAILTVWNKSAERMLLVFFGSVLFLLRDLDVISTGGKTAAWWMPCNAMQ